MRSNGHPIVGVVKTLICCCALCYFLCTSTTIAQLRGGSTPAQNAANTQVASTKDADSSIPLDYRLQAFICGLGGAFVLYFVQYRLERLERAIRERILRLFLIDVLLFLVAGGVTATFLVNYTGDLAKEAFLIGSTWQGLVGSKGHVEVQS